MARAIDAYSLNNDFVEWYNDQTDEIAKSVLREIMQKVNNAPTLTPSNEWVSVKDAMPPEHETVLCIVSGRPKPHIILDETYQLGSWNKGDGWIIDEYLEWTDADVLWWRMLPVPPYHRPPEGEEEEP